MWNVVYLYVAVKRWFVERVIIMESLLALSESVFIANTWLDTEKHQEVLLALSGKKTCGAQKAYYF